MSFPIIRGPVLSAQSLLAASKPVQQELQRNTRGPSLPAPHTADGSFSRRPPAKAKPGVLGCLYITGSRSLPLLPFPAPLISHQLHGDREPALVLTAPAAPEWLGACRLALWITGSSLKFLLGGMTVNCTSCDNPSLLAFFPLGN